jgi:hypothetical protein
MTERWQLQSLVVIVTACFLVGESLAWTWYLVLIFLVAFVVFWAICGLFWWNRKHTPTEDTPPSMPVTRENALDLPDAERPDHHEITSSSTIVSETSEKPDPTLDRFPLRRLAVHVVVFVLMVSALVLVAHLNVFVAAGAVLTGNILAILLEPK